MTKEIRTQAIRMLFVLFVLLGLTAWQIEFVVRSVEANIYLNLTIILTYIFGTILAFRSVLSLRNEMVALTALKVQYQDRGTEPDGCYDRPAAVFQPPELLGHAFRLITDELTKTQPLALPTATVKMLVEGVDIRIDDRRSTLNYITGLLVFLGLIGTFVGLMQTVGSVGDIIGSLNFGGEGGPDIDEAFAGLIADLQGPLVGMATGFSSSLFGLLCSLALGMIERFGTAAHRILPLEFESWLTNIAQLESAAPEADGQDNAAQAGTDPALIKRLARVEVQISDAARAAKTTQESLQELVIGVHTLAEAQDNSPASASLDALSDLAREMVYTQRGFMDQLRLQRELSEAEREFARDSAAQIAGGFAAIREDQAGLGALISGLTRALEGFTQKSATRPEQLQMTQQVPEVTAVQMPQFDPQPPTRLEQFFGSASARREAKAAQRAAENARMTYHELAQDILQQAFSHDSELAKEIKRLGDRTIEQGDSVELLVESSRNMQAHNRAISESLQSVATLLSQPQDNSDVLDEVRRSRIGMEVALRQITGALRDVSEAQNVHTAMERKEVADGSDLEAKAG